MFRQNKKGFTLIELLVVIAVIGLLATLGVVALNNAREKSRNAKRLSDIKQYHTAFEMALDDISGYPLPGADPYSTYCLGDYSDDNCWFNGTNTDEDATLNAILANYIPGLPVSEGVVCGTDGFEGTQYYCADTVITGGVCTKVYLSWFMEGANQSCGIGEVLVGDYNGQGCTYCRLTIFY